jgi:O-antigen ligase
VSIFSIKEKNRLKILEGLLKRIFQIFVFIIPTQLALHLWPEWAFVYGIRIDYYSPAIYLSDILIFVILFLWVIHSLLLKKRLTLKKSIILPVFISIFILINILVSMSPELSFLKWIKLLEMLSMAFFITKFRKIEIHKWILLPLSLSLILFTSIGIGQFILKSTIGGFFYFLGERSFSVNTPGVALVNFNGNQLLRAYSTFPHPNSLAGFIVINIFLLLNYEKQIKKELFRTTITFAFVGLIITFSKSAFLGLLICLTFLLLEKRVKMIKRNTGLLFLTLINLLSILSLTVNWEILGNRLFKSESILQRISLIKISTKMFLENPFFGVGLNNFIANIPKYLDNNLWILQPVHNIYLLVLVESGLIGLLLFFVGIVKIFDKASINKYFFLIFIFILISGYFDHYWLTIQQNLILVTLVAALNFRKSMN